ncbi:MAG: 4-hydroxy-3-methylbut-2-enyl diphosphate reductase [Deltaproteobacteria bacterium]|nr:MAG: 4-hydroxy-3-methylbut-2-enyl diphosphate reductase [Deltaproteobacteria bacterium]
MEILLAKSAGFCFGVKRAINLAFSTAKKRNKVFCLGPIIHNPQVVEELKCSGVQEKEKLEEIKEGTIILRSHGVSPEVIEKARGRGLEIVDATCPFVMRSQQFVRRLAEEGYFILIVGDRRHPEVQGIMGQARGEVLVIDSPKGLRGLKRRKRVGVVTQTTQTLENLKEIVAKVLEKTQEVRVLNSICSATAQRQLESRRLAGKVDCMLVVGGYNSSNTNKLAEICQEVNPRTYHIEEAGEMKASWFRGARRVGLTGGASTPSWLIDQIVEKVQDFERNGIKA